MVRYLALRDFYTLDKTIGCGGFAKVKLATHIATGEKVAIKIMEKIALKEDLPRVKLEIEAMKNLSHQHICKLYQVIETEEHYFMILEYCSGGELFDHIVEKSRLIESEARKFFRQIVSAIAYLHSLGYAHRDIKPENVLLDKDQNLKLIDFGLCAKPSGGMQSHLYTSCGSPTYAAPELILGNKYLGSEIDIWSLGVLLYALLCGFLPFDDQNIENLYKKILSGRYDEPEWLSQSSKRLIRAMLQVDPKQRITIKDLCDHPWMTAGFLNPISVVKIPNFQRDEDALCILSEIFGEDSDELWEKISAKNNNDYKTATYLLLSDKKNDSFHQRKYRLYTTPEDTTLLTKQEENRRSDQNLDRSVKGRKRLRNRDLDDLPSPIPLKKLTNDGKQFTPTTKRTNDYQSTPGSARKVMINLEKHLNKVRRVLTPKRQMKTEDADIDKPNTFMAKGLCNISSTTSDSPKEVLSQLRYALQCKGIHCKQKRFILHGETEILNENPRASKISSKSTCSFELEVCYIKNIPEMKPIVGIRRKRLRGDAWVYKRVCEEVLALAAKQTSNEKDTVLI